MAYEKDVVSVDVILSCIFFIVSPFSDTDRIINSTGKGIILLTAPAATVGKTDDYQTGAAQILGNIKG